MARRHLAIFLRGTSEDILSAKKQVEIRLSQSRVLPYEAIIKDDEIYLKNSGGKIIGKVYVDNVLYYDKITPEIFAKIKKQYQEPAKMDEDFWLRHRHSRYISIIFLKNPRKFLTPVVYKKRDRRPWIILEEEK